MTVEELRTTFGLQESAPDGRWLGAFLRLACSGPLARLLRDCPDLLEQVRQTSWRFLQQHPARTLLSQGGLMLDSSFARSLQTRLLGKFLPPAPQEGSLRDQLRLALERSRGFEMSQEELEGWLELLAPPPEHPLWQHLRGEVWEALNVVSQRLVAQAMEGELARQSGEFLRAGNPFLEQLRELGRCIDSPGLGDAHLLVLLNHCEEVLDKVKRRVLRRGTSTQLTYSLVGARQSIERMRLLLDLAQGRLDEAQRSEFWLALARSEGRRHSLSDLSSYHWRVLLWRVTHHAGETGHHYIAENRSQLWSLFRAACGAGLIVAVMALLKGHIKELHLPLLFQALFYSLNYGLGFVLIHLLSFTIATKQPAMTASSLAQTVSEDWNGGAGGDLSGVLEKCRQIWRSQWVAILGNVVVAFPMAWLLSALLSDPLSAERAGQILHELDPLASWALFHAALAGVGLFLSGMFSGYVDNLSAYYDLPDRLRHARWLGPWRRHLGDYLESESGAIAGNLALGFYLGSLFAVGKVSGLPLDIRHVSFASANLGQVCFSLQTTGWELLRSWVGIAAIGLFNLAVSFGLALMLALRARGVGLLEVARWGKPSVGRRNRADDYCGSGRRSSPDAGRRAGHPAPV